MIKSDTDWQLDAARSRPIKGWYVYTREIVTNDDVTEIIKTMKPKGQSPITIMHKEGERVVLTCSLDSGD